MHMIETASRAIDCCVSESIIPTATLCYPLLPSATLCYPLLPSATLCYPLLPAATRCYPLLPAGELDEVVLASLRTQRTGEVWEGRRLLLR
jgi:hypothetical protein